ncbi:MAG: exodeoxyribonuclease III [Candidatus Fermentibacter sp.]|nr:exodeoxyribonuclease III [Candidatus Fermentibacter sp.]
MGLKVATWNVNSIRARIEQVLSWIDSRHPDVLLMQETKVVDSIFPVDPFRERGYVTAFSGQKTLNGVAVASRHGIEVIRTGLASRFLDDQKRVLLARTAGITVMSVYVPNGGDPSLARFADKLAFLGELALEASEEARRGPFLMAGDFNVAPGDEDVDDPVAMDGHICFHPEERARFGGILDAGLTDLFRVFNPAGRAFSWWDYREGSFRRNIGMRLDHVLASQDLAGAAVSCGIDREPRGWEKPSDHAPVVAVFDLPGTE